MTIYSGQVNLTRYKVLGEAKTGKAPPAGRPVPFATLDDAITGWKAAPLEALMDEGKGRDMRFMEVMTGWVAPDGLLASREWQAAKDDAGGEATDSDWSMAMAAVNDGVLLRMRIDRRKVPAALIKAVYKQKLKREETGKSGRSKRLPRAERDALKQHVRESLTSRALPSCAFVDAFWREAAGELWVFTTSETALKAFEELFARTFGGKLEVTLARIQPPMTAAPADLWTGTATGKGDSLAEQWLSSLAETTPM
ncbi:MAG: putative exonuclease, RdgC [Pseudomonadota bacterium]|jgi:hypothetical protein